MGTQVTSSTDILDIDGDGNLDTYRCDPGDGYIMIFYGNGNGKFSFQVLPLSGVLQAGFVNMDGDGKLELVYRAWPAKDKLTAYELLSRTR